MVTILFRPELINPFRTVATDAVVLKHQAINIHSDD